MVIENVTLRELVAKEPKYREPNKINWKSIKSVILDSDQEISCATYLKFEKEDSITKTKIP